MDNGEIVVPDTNLQKKMFGFFTIRLKLHFYPPIINTITLLINVVSPLSHVPFSRILFKNKISGVNSDDNEN